MSIIIENALIKINEKLINNEFNNSLKIEIIGEGTIFITQNGAFTEPSDVECTMTSDLETFEGIINGTIKASGDQFSVVIPYQSMLSFLPAHST